MLALHVSYLIVLTERDQIKSNLTGSNLSPEDL